MGRLLPAWTALCGDADLSARVGQTKPLPALWTSRAPCRPRVGLTQGRALVAPAHLLRPREPALRCFLFPYRPVGAACFLLLDQHLL